MTCVQYLLGQEERGDITMGWNDHIGDNANSIITCSHCGKQYIQWTEEQVPGNRMKDEDVCPYCGGINGSSMSVEYHNRKIEK